ncbi:helix-turn-helix domain-containing protein [Streptomyces marianii]|uniref:AraC family transcriptional regulator n=1 Tax=Streptomyces marianii TaxID=1817406 RepID=A0A5R9E516_9ACTN|nr:helix-turn-helix domain-containing protein [Streptomyces marianii]TLQ44407.1 AraC family transcriptional regulator [Streptomyces marianii]
MASRSEPGGAGGAPTAGGPGPRRDTRGIVDAPELFARVRFRRREPAPPLRPYLEHYWLVDWDLPEPYITHVVPHPSVNTVFQRYGDEEPWAEVAGIGLGLFTQKLRGRGRVCGVQFRPGGFRPFAPGRPVSAWTGHRVPAADVFTAAGGSAGAAPSMDAAAVVLPEEEDARVAALDAFLLALRPEADPQADHAMALVERVRTDRTIRRVAQLAAADGVTARTLQRLFAAYVGVGPKWVILRYRIHEALERAEADGPAADPGRTVVPDGGTGADAAGARSRGAEPDWSALAAELGYSDQAHLVRDFTATVGVPPTAYAATRTPG